MPTIRDLLFNARLYVLVDGCASPEGLVQLVRGLVNAGTHVIQLREKRLGDRELVMRARLVRTLTRETATLFIVNDRPDIAVLSEADGVHVGQDELTVADCRTIVGPDRLVGVSTHSVEQFRRAAHDGADYVGCGPTFPSPTKQFETFPGLAFLRAVHGELLLPAFAIGGIRQTNVDQVLATGFPRIAVGAAVTAASDPAAAAQSLLETLSGSPTDKPPPPFR